VTAIERRAAVVVPCYNESRRIDRAAFLQLARGGRVRLLFVNDGSTDDTGALLKELAAACEAIEAVDLPTNQGKGEAVRRGLLMALEEGAPSVGYYDADLATPPEELLRLIDALEGDPALTAVFGARVARLGSTIERSLFRHFAGRFYATVASLAVGADVYDTQCGAKVFRAGPEMAAALAQPFGSTWAFDVALLDRLLQGNDRVAGLSIHAFLEVPLVTWRHVRGSKLNVPGAGRALAAVVGIGLARSRRDRKRNHRPGP
jgi:glycosyltransferase involved in cell wall biosynthesis